MRRLSSVTIIQGTSVARKDPKPKSSREGGTGAGMPAKLDNAGARDILTEISPLSITDDVENALLQYDYDDLNSRAGGHSWGLAERLFDR